MQQLAFVQPVVFCEKQFVRAWQRGEA